MFNHSKLLLTGLRQKLIWALCLSLAMAFLGCEESSPRAGRRAKNPPVPPSVRIAENAMEKELDGDDEWAALLLVAQPPDETPPPKVTAAEDGKPFEPWQQEVQDRQAHFRWQKIQGSKAAHAADKAREFHQRFPEHPMASNAKIMEYQLLEFAATMGDVSRESRLAELEKTYLADDPDSRFQLRFRAAHRAAMAHRDYSSESRLRFVLELENCARLLLEEFPGRPEVYDLFYLIAENSSQSKAEELIDEIVTGPADPALKKKAEKLRLEVKYMDLRERPVGKRPPLAFTAHDGREINVLKMKGKVVIIFFWASWSVESMEQMPELVELHAKHADAGLEMVGVNCDREKDVFEETLKAQGITWPQHFDGKGFVNFFRVQFAVDPFPAVWVVDKSGIIRFADGGRDIPNGKLKERVEKLLSEE